MKRGTLLVGAGIMVCLFGAMALGEDPQVLRLATLTMDSINPTLMMGRPGNMQVSSLIYDSLVIRKQDGSAGPEIAESWETPDNLTWIFHIRQGMTWQDGNEIWAEGQGRAVTAHDVVFSLELQKKYNMMLKSQLSRCVGIVALDDYTVQITTDIPMPRLVTSIGALGNACIFPPEAATEHAAGVNLLPIGSGPFELKEFVAGSKAILTKNEDYWITVKLDEVQYVVMSDPAARVIALEAGAIDFCSSAPTSEGTRLLGLGYVRVGVMGSPYNIGFNTTKAPFDDYRVREGISLVLDVDSAWSAVLPAEFALRAYGHQGPWNVYNYDPAPLMVFDRYDVGTGLAMLADAGWTDSNGDGWLDKAGAKLSIAIKTWGGDQVQVLTILATQLLQVGIDAKVEVVETASYAKDLVQGNSGMFFDYMYSNDTGLYSLFHSANIGSSNTHFNRDPGLDTVLETAMGLDPAASADFWKAAEQLVVANRYIIPMYFAYETNFITPQVKDFISPQGSVELVSVQNNVYIETGK